MQSLKYIQTLSKIGRIFSKIIYICCIIGICGCAVGIVAMLVGGEALKIGGVTLHSFLKTEAGISTGTILATSVVGIILCAGELSVSRMAYRYFEHELNVGTPFTSDSANELKTLGISVIWIPIVANILAHIAQAIIAGFMEDVEPVTLEGFDSIALGVMFIVMSLLCRYGAELRDGEEK